MLISENLSMKCCYSFYDTSLSVNRSPVMYDNQNNCHYYHEISHFFEKSQQIGSFYREKWPQPKD